MRREAGLKSPLDSPVAQIINFCFFFFFSNVLEKVGREDNEMIKRARYF